MIRPHSESFGPQILMIIYSLFRITEAQYLIVFWEFGNKNISSKNHKMQVDEK